MWARPVLSQGSSTEERNDGGLVALEQDEIETVGESELGDVLLEFSQVLGAEEAQEEGGQTEK